LRVDHSVFIELTHGYDRRNPGRRARDHEKERTKYLNIGDGMYLRRHLCELNTSAHLAGETRALARNPDMLGEPDSLLPPSLRVEDNNVSRS